MRLLKASARIYFFYSLCACTLYKSPDRKDFESKTANFRIENLKLASCSNDSLSALSESSRLISIFNNSLQNNSVFLWEHKVNNSSAFETDNLKGIYCVYENN